MEEDVSHDFELLVFDTVLLVDPLEVLRKHADALLENLVIKSHLLLAILLGATRSTCRRAR